MSTDDQLRTDDLQCRIQVTESLVSVRGEVDLSNERELAAALDAARRPGESTVIDLSGVSFMDSCALRSCVGFHQGGNELIVRRPSHQVLRLLNLAALDTVFQIETEDSISS